MNIDREIKSKNLTIPVLYGDGDRQFFTLTTQLMSNSFIRNMWIDQFAVKIFAIFSRNNELSSKYSSLSITRTLLCKTKKFPTTLLSENLLNVPIKFRFVVYSSFFVRISSNFGPSLSYVSLGNRIVSTIKTLNYTLWSKCGRKIIYFQITKSIVSVCIHR